MLSWKMQFCVFWHDWKVFPLGEGISYVLRACKNISINAWWIKERMFYNLTSKTRQFFKIPEKLTFWKFKFFISSIMFTAQKPYEERSNEAILLNYIQKTTIVGKYSHRVVIGKWSLREKSKRSINQNCELKLKKEGGAELNCLYGSFSSNLCSMRCPDWSQYKLSRFAEWKISELL